MCIFITDADHVVARGNHKVVPGEECMVVYYFPDIELGGGDSLPPAVNFSHLDKYLVRYCYP